jgi:hypothetical protein
MPQFMPQGAINTFSIFFLNHSILSEQNRKGKPAGFPLYTEDYPVA